MFISSVSTSASILLLVLFCKLSHASDIPQHRLRSSKRHLAYNTENHPWLRDVDTVGSIELKRSRSTLKKGNSERKLSVQTEFLPLSEINSWSVTSPRVDYNVTDGFGKIRIRASLLDHLSSGASFLSDQERSQLLTAFVIPSIDAWSDALFVPPVNGNLTIDKEQLYDGVTCGPGIGSGHPSVLIPLEDFNPGISNTDLQIYLSLGFTEELANISQNKIENSPQYYYNASINNEKAIGYSDSSHRIIPTCDGSYIAASTFCSTDQFDRPVAGMIHLCMSADFFEPQNKELNIGMITHELGHILGFNSLSMAHFRDPQTGEPLTPRDINGDVEDVTVECAGISSTYRSAAIPLPSNKILQFREVRDIRAAYIVTPLVSQVARNHFDCQELIGAELETDIYPIVSNTNQDFVGSCISDHWERRIFKYDLMNPIVDEGSVSGLPRISSLTLAYFADSGWYRVDLSKIKEPDIWGRGAGCDFVNEPCINKDGSLSWMNSQYFCNSGSNEEICTKDLKGKGRCQLVSYDHLPFEYNYFGYENGVIGGDDEFLDYCPVVQPSKEGLCSVEPSRHFRMEEFDTTSSCVSGQVNKKSTPLCVPTACNFEDKTLHIRVDGIWTTCEFDDQTVVSWFDEDNYVFCPKKSNVCPSFVCPADCFHGDSVGVCDYDTGKCMCSGLVDNNGTLQETYSTCNVPDLTSYDYLSSISEFYVRDSSSLDDDDKNLFDATLRMFIQMDVGEVIGFVASSLLAIGSITLFSFSISRFLRTKHGRFTNMFKFWKREWRIDRLSLNNRMRAPSRMNKDKMIATVIHNSRIEAAQENDLSLDERLEYIEDVDETNHENETVYFERSDLPPLPTSTLGRVIYVIGATLLNDTIGLRNEEEATSSAVETEESETSTGNTHSDLENTSYQEVTTRQRHLHP